jgi:transposase-like protein
VAKKLVNRYPKAFRLMALEQMKSCDNVSELARELNVDRSVLYLWRDPVGRRR